jgi:hypothetical protein
MKRRYQEGGPIDEMEEANNRSMLNPRKVSIGSADEEDDNLKKRAMERSRILQQEISSGSDFKGRPQDEGYRPNAGTAKERATAEGAYDLGKITESGDQGFGGPGSSRVVKATPKAASKDMPKATSKSEARDTGSDMARMMNRAKSVEKPVDETKLSANERTKRNIEKNLSGARSGSGPTDKRSANERIKAMFGMKSGGLTASKRGDGIAQRGKTRGKMC